MKLIRLTYIIFKIITKRKRRLMKIRVQLIQNSHLHKIPTILLNIHNNQYMFNIIPTLLRHRKNHQINLINHTNIFFTKHSIQTLGGLPNLILYTYKADQANSHISPIFNVYCDNFIFNYLEKLRFKLGYKVLKMSYCNWIGDKFRFGINNKTLLQKLQKEPDFPHYFSKIQQKLSRKPFDKKDYYNSKHFITNEPLQYIGKPINYFSDRHISVIPLSRSKDSNAQVCISYICIPKQLKKQESIDIIQFMKKTQICDDKIIHQFEQYGHIKIKDGRYFRKQQFMLKQNVKPKNMIILHYNNDQSLRRLYRNDILNDYLQRNNQTGLIIHIVQDIQLTYSQEFRSFIQRFGKDAKHLWYNSDCIVYENSIVQNQFHIISNSIWHNVFPQFLVNIFKNKLTYRANHQQQQIISNLSPFSYSIFYKKMYYNILKNDKVEEIQLNKSVLCTKEVDILKSLINKYSKQLIKIKSKQVADKRPTNFAPKVAFLGTASGFPTTNRNTMGILLSMNTKLNIFLDCGQGTYEQMADHFPKQSFERELLKTQILFITHIHPDHNLGILNLISQRKKLMHKYNHKKKLFLIIPFNVFNWYIQYNKTVEDLSQCCDVIFTQCLKHKNHPQQIAYIQSYFSLNNKSLTSSHPQIRNKFFNIKQVKQRCQKYEILQFQISKKSKELIAKELNDNYSIKMSLFEKILKQNLITIFEPVEVIHCPQSYGIIISNDQFKISYSGDTRPSETFKKKASNSTLMIHQATFDDVQAELAQQALHSTVLEAIKIGKQSGSTKTVLTHFGQKMKSHPLQNEYNEQIVYYLKKNVIYSFDHLQIDLDNMSYLPQMTQFMAKIQSQKSQLLLNQDALQQQNKS